MKKFIFILFLFLGLSVQNFASTGMEKIDVVKDGKESLKTELVNDSEVVPDKNEVKNVITEQEDMALYQNEDKLFGCWIYTVTCHDCDKSFRAQWCDEGFHGDLGSWAAGLCEDACEDEL